MPIDARRAAVRRAVALLLASAVTSPAAAAPFKLQCEVEYLQRMMQKRQPEQVVKFNYIQVIRVDPEARTVILEKRVNFAQRKAIDEVRVATDIRELNDDRIAVCLDTVGKCAAHVNQVGDQPVTAYAKPTLIDLVNMKFRAFDTGEYRNGNDWGFVITTGKGDCRRLPS